MFKKVFLVLTMGIFLFSVSGVWAADATSGKAPSKATVKSVKKTKKTKTVYHWFTGKVKSMDAEQKAIIIEKKTKKGTKEITVSIGDKTKFVGLKGLAEVKVGEKLSIKYKVVNGKNEAVRIVKKVSKRKRFHKKGSVKGKLPEQKQERK